MKIKLIVLFLALVPVLGWGQIVDGKDIGSDSSVVYLEIMGYTLNPFSKKVTIIVDYGQKITIFDTDTRVEDSKGKVIKFNSMMDAANYFHGLGWKLMFAYDVSSGGSGTVYHYVYNWIGGARREGTPVVRDEKPEKKKSKDDLYGN